MDSIESRLNAMDVKTGTALVRELAGWAFQDPGVSVFVQILADEVTRRGDKEDATLDPGCLLAKSLCDELHDLYTHVLKRLNNNDDYKVTTDNFSKFKNGDSAPRFRIIPLIFLIWLHREAKKNRFDNESRVVRLLKNFNPLSKMEDRIVHGIPLPRDGEQDPVPMHRTKDLDQLAMEQFATQGFAKLLGLEDIAAEQVRHDFFLEGEDVAHFLVYRRSVNDGAIIKGFLAMEAPRQEGGVAYSFTHFYRDALDAFRETRGLVLTLRQAHYLVGGGGDTNSEPAYEKGQPRKRPPISQGIKCIAVERNLSAAQNNVWSGLFLSHAQGWKPIAGRCVLVRARYNTYQSRFRGQKGIPKSAEV